MRSGSAPQASASGQSPKEETRLLTAAEVSSWARSAVPGESLVYCSGPHVPAGPTKAKVSDLVQASVARAHIRRIAGTLEHYLVKRPDVPPAMEPAPPTDEAMEAIFEALERCVDRRQRAYSLRQLARIAGLPTREQARHRLSKLEDAQRISTTTVRGPDGTAWRIVRIGKRSTLGPPKAEVK